MLRVYHPFTEWEEMRFNMWGCVKDTSKALDQAITFTGDYIKYGESMLQVVREWPISCENALTDPALNKKAWVGHAAVALTLKIPEHITRQAWGFLTYEQRLLANQKADFAIKVWQHNYFKDKQLYQNMGGQMLFKWNTG